MLIQTAAFAQCCGVFSGGVQDVAAKCGDLFLPSAPWFKMCGSRQFVTLYLLPNMILGWF